MAFTRPKAAQIDFDLTNITDTIIRLNSSESGDNTNDLGIVFERGNHTNAAIVWDESADTFRLISTTHDASTHTGDINISDHHNLTLKRVTQSEQQYTQKLIKPQLWHKQTTTAGFIIAFEVLTSTIYGNVTVDIDVVPRADSQKANVTVNTTQSSEQASVDTGYTAVDMQNIYSLADNDLIINDADNVFMHGDTGYNTKQYVLYGTTTDGTADVEIFVGGTSNSRVPVPTNPTMLYTVDIVARRTDATGESAGWQLKAVADNFSDTVADVGTVYEILVATDDANWSADCRADDTTDAIKILCTGAAGKTIKWIAVVKTMEVTN